MNKNQGLIMGTVLGAVLLFRPTDSSGPKPAPTPVPGAAVTETAQRPEPKLGPWMASCNYWAPAQDAQNAPEGGPEIYGTLKDGKIDLHLDLEEGRKSQEPGCGSDPEKRWGFPVRTDVKITAIIATVPDPVHTHLALAFDRTIAAILEAAVDNHYVSSSYWLPWRARAGESKAETSDSEPGHDPERERQPGLIILRSDGGSPEANYGSVVYLFLVAETPTQGIDGYQMQNALQYEIDLQNYLMNRGQRFSTGSAFTAILGAYYSGSIPSLTAALRADRRRPGSLAFHVAATTSTAPKLDDDGNSISFAAFGDDRVFGRNILHTIIERSGIDTARIAELVEDNTVLSSSFKQNEKDVQQIHFPREISLLRNAQSFNEAGATGSAGSIPSPYLRLSLRDTSGQDTVPQFSRVHTPLSQEAQLMAIARQIHRFRSQFVTIVASDILDQVFLAQFKWPYEGSKVPLDKTRPISHSNCALLPGSGTFLCGKRSLQV